MIEVHLDDLIAAMAGRLALSELKANEQQLGSTHIVRQQIHHARQLVEALAYGAEDTDADTPIEKGAL